MSDIKKNARLGLIRSLLEPIQQTLARLLRDDPNQKFNKRARKAVIAAAEAALVREFPLTRLIPSATRKSIIASQLDVILDDIVLNEKLPEASAGTGFEGFILRVEQTGSEAARAIAEGAVMRVLGQGWTISSLPLDNYSFYASSDQKILSVPRVWEMTYALSEQPRIAAAEPSFIVPMESNMPEEAPLAARSLLGGTHLPGSEKPEWSINAIRVREAWALNPPRAEGGQQGEGVVVGHPDTGYTKHPENWSNNPPTNKILYRQGFDFWKDDAEAMDDLDSGIFCALGAGFACIPGHGTGTSSVIFSDEGSPAGKGQFVTGVAPRTRLIPFRVAPTVVLWNQRRLADAIIRATDTGCHVISISLGGLPSGYLLAALQRAVNRDVIVCCAAGNIFGASNLIPAVVWPAAYDEAIAVAATNIESRPWSGSSRGNAVDISAPGESVWHAIAKKGERLGAVDRGSGTSFAVAHVAGVAALWLAYHGRDWLLSRHRGRLVSVFRTILTTAGFTRPPGHWDAQLFGNGIIDAVKVLEASLPEVTFAAVADRVVKEQMHFDQISNLLSDVPRSALRRELAALLNTNEPSLSSCLRDVGDELVFHLFSDASAREDFRKLCKTGKSASGRASRTLSTTRRAAARAQMLMAASPRLRTHLQGGLRTG